MHNANAQGLCHRHPTAKRICHVVIRNAAVAATMGLLENLSYQEIAGVMAHELACEKPRYFDYDDNCDLGRRSIDVVTFAMFFGVGAGIALGSGFYSGNDLGTFGGYAGSNGNFADTEYQADRLGAEIAANRFGWHPR